MIASCPSCTENTEEAKKCADITSSYLSFLPVEGRDGYTYRSVYCANCNNQSVTNYFTIEILCNQYKRLENTSVSDFLRNTKDCNLQTRPHIFPCELEGNKDADCKPDHPLYEICRSYLGKIEGYSNIHCSRCAGNLNDPKLYTNSQCEKLKKYLPSENYGIGTGIVYSATIDFIHNLRTDTKEIRLGFVLDCAVGVKCPSHQHCVPELDACVNLLCRDNLLAIDGRCVNVIKDDSMDIIINSTFESCLLRNCLFSYFTIVQSPKVI